eukprot:6193104-Pleurochrysis_carterae.AAC.2
MGACREADASTVHEYNEDLVRKPTPQPLRLFSLMGGQRVWFATGTSTKIAGWSWFAKAEVVRLLRCNSSPYEATHVEHILEVCTSEQHIAFLATIRRTEYAACM